MNEVNRQPGFPLVFEDVRPNAARAERQINLSIRSLDAGKPFENPLVKRRHQPDPQTGPRQRFRQRAHHIGQPARLGIGMDLGAGEQDFHGMRGEKRVRLRRDPVGLQVRLQARWN